MYIKKLNTLSSRQASQSWSSHTAACICYKFLLGLMEDSVVLAIHAHCTKLPIYK